MKKSSFPIEWVMVQQKNPKTKTQPKTVNIAESRKQNLQVRNYINGSHPHSFLLLSKNPLIHFLLHWIESTKAFYSIK